MAMDDPPHIGQADAGPLELLGAVQALKHAEQLVDVPHVEADAVVADEEHRFTRLAPAANRDFRFGARAGVLDRVGDQVAKDEPEHDRIALYLGQLPDVPGDGAAADLRRDIAPGLLHQFLHRDRGAAHHRASHPGKSQQVIHQGSRVPGRFPDGVQVTPIGFIQVGSGTFLQHLREAVEVAQWRAQVVGDGVGERFQLLVGLFQLGRALHHPTLEGLIELPDFFFCPLAFGNVAQVTREHRRPTGENAGNRQLDRELGPIGAHRGHFKPLPECLALARGQIAR